MVEIEKQHYKNVGAKFFQLKAERVIWKNPRNRKKKQYPEAMQYNMFIRDLHIYSMPKCTL
jgi:hypothetical protein